jgi:predicted ArsR family transcriptional regulator
MGYYDQQKKNRYERIKSLIEDEGPIEKQKIISKTKIDMGLSNEKVEEYLDDLENAGEIQNEENVIKRS